MSRFFLASSVLALAEAGTLSVTWSDCGSKHGTTTDVSPSTIQTGSKATLTLTGTLDEDVTSAHIAATVSALGTKLTDCSGDGTKDIVCTLPMGVGTITLPALSFPLQKGTISVPCVVDVSAAIPPSLANVDVHLTGEDQNGESAVCLDVHTTASSDEASACDYVGHWRTESANDHSLERYGAVGYKREDGLVYSLTDGRLQDPRGQVGTIQSNCNVIDWSDGGTWLRTGDDADIVV